MKVLIVDDVAAVRSSIRKTLMSAGYHDLVEARNGTEGYDKLANIDLILTDIVMPGMNGCSFVRAVREKPGYQDTPIIVISAVNDVETLCHIMQHGANDYMIKPFDKTALVEKVDYFASRMESATGNEEVKH